MTVSELLRLAPFSLGAITVFLAACGLLFAHAYSRYGEDATVAFMVRLRFLAAGLLVVALPVLMLVSFGRGDVPAWLGESRAAGLAGLALLATGATVGFLLIAVSSPRRFLRPAGRRASVRRLNRAALAARWRDVSEFRSDLASHRHRLLGWDAPFRPGPPPKRRIQVRWFAMRLAMTVRRSLLITFRRTDPSEALFNAAAAGLRNSNMSTWRGALGTLGEHSRGRMLTTDAVDLLVANAMALEDIAHRQGSEDGKVRLCSALGEIGGVSMNEDAATRLAKGISALAEKRLGEHRPVLAAIAALETVSTRNCIAAVKASGWLGQHLAALPPPAAVYGFDGDGIEHPTNTLFGLLCEIADRADNADEAKLNDALIDACSMICRSLPGAQDRESMTTLGMALRTTGEAAARRYARKQSWFGTLDAVRSLVALERKIHEVDGQPGDQTTDWIAEVIGRVGCWVIANDDSLGPVLRDGRNDMAAVVADQLLELDRGSIRRAFVELATRQHNSEIPTLQFHAFLALCQDISGDLLGMRRIGDGPHDAPED